MSFGIPVGLDLDTATWMVDGVVVATGASLVLRNSPKSNRFESVYFQKPGSAPGNTLRYLSVNGIP